jgi:Family of unknown function (DUF5985)
VYATIYSLCALTSLLCAWLLLRAYGKQHIALLFWCGLFFSIQTCANILLVIDKLMLPDIDLSMYRYGIALVAVGVLLYGLVMRAEVD